MVPISDSTTRDSALAELVEYSAQASLKKKARRSPDRSQRSLATSVEENVPSAIASNTGSFETASDLTLQLSRDSYAAPLSPLRERDLKALTKLFEHNAIAEIEADILYNLQRSFPEPCWEDEFGL